MFSGPKLGYSPLYHISPELTKLTSNMKAFSIAQRMSWASKRVLTRPEDTAYCLMGIFDVNMPLLYGEGDKAFSRLQEELLRSTDDQSLFAWDQIYPVAPEDCADLTYPESNFGRKGHPLRHRICWPSLQHALHIVGKWSHLIAIQEMTRFWWPTEAFDFQGFSFLTPT